MVRHGLEAKVHLTLRPHQLRLGPTQLKDAQAPARLMDLAVMGLVERGLSHPLAGFQDVQIQLKQGLLRGGGTEYNGNLSP